MLIQTLLILNFNTRMAVRAFFRPSPALFGCRFTWTHVGRFWKAGLSLEKYKQCSTSVESCVFQTHLQTSEHTSSTFSYELRVILDACLKIQPWAVSSLMHKQTRQCPRAGAGEDLLHRSSKNITTLPSWQNEKEEEEKKLTKPADQSEAGSPVSIRKQPCHLSLGVTADSSEERERLWLCCAEGGWKVIQHRRDLSSSH